MPVHRGGTVEADALFLHSDFVGSYDSRYFGPLPAEGVLGLAQEVLTFAP
jgi:type IV secretory pathway protease TraF